MVPDIKEIVDLSHPMYSNMPNIGGQVTFFQLDDHAYLSEITGGRMAMESRMILMPEHCGTHLDAPRHSAADGVPLDKVPLEQLVLPGHLLDLTHKENGEAIAIDDFRAAAERSGRAIGPGVATVCWTGSDKDWGKEGFAANRPFVPTETAHWLVDRGVDVTQVSRRGQTTVDMANGPVQRIQPFPDTIALLESLGAKNNHRCLSC